MELTKFSAGSFLHFLVLMITVVSTAILIYLGRSLKSKQTYRIGFVLASILIINYIVYIIYRIHEGYWELRYDLPMELCNWSAIVTSLALITHNRTQAELSYYWVMSGSIQGVITPDLSVGFPHIYFFIFFIAHSGLVASTLYLIFGLKLYPRRGSVFRAILWIEIYFITAFVINSLLKSNYGYLMSKPQNGSALDYLGPWPYYLIVMQLIGITSFIFLYIPFYIYYKKNKCIPVPQP